MDRNNNRSGAVTPQAGTFPARGTWIEIWWFPAILLGRVRTFPARGTWIEMRRETMADKQISDVPRKGNVDRNNTLKN